MIDHRHLVPEGFLDPSGEGGFSAAGAARNADNDAFVVSVLFLFVYFKDPVIHLSFLACYMMLSPGLSRIL
jgi:hypothetical protein